MLPPWTPDLVSLDLLLAVAETGSIGRAAEAHGISQPSASARLSRLERRLGVALLVRDTTGTRLTPTGTAIAAWAGEVVTAARQLTDAVTSLREQAGARLSIAASLTVAEYLLPAWLLTLRAQHPELDVAATVANSHEVAERVRSGEADLGFLEAPEAPTGVSVQQIGTDDLVLVVAPGDPLAARASEGVDAAHIVDLPLLLREPGSGTRDTFLQALTDALGDGTRPTLPHATTLGSTATILAATRAGGGVGVLSARAAASDIAAGQLVRIPLRDAKPQRPLNAIWLGRTPSALGRELIAIAVG